MKALLLSVEREIDLIVSVWYLRMSVNLFDCFPGCELRDAHLGRQQQRVSGKG
jgi:hypothetical protein